MIQFTKDCEIGIPQIDQEHAYLFELVNEAYGVLGAEESERAVSVRNILMKLQDYAKEHFAHEEEYMAVIQDPELPIQHREHVLFAKKVAGFIVEAPFSISYGC